VGGAVRDLLLGHPVRDADLVLEGDAAGLAAEVGSRLGAGVTLVVHERFGTATLELADGTRFDIAAARRETYEYPGALPAVTLGATLEEDLRRRDFSIHAMALDLLRRPHRIVDPWAGAADLAARRIRFLHPDSPADDPTRAFRAVRYANRLGFSVAPEARRQIASAIAIGAFDAVSGDRLRREIEKLFAEPGRGRAVAGLVRLGLDRAILPALAKCAEGSPQRLRAAEFVAETAGGASWLCYFLAWMAPARIRSRKAAAGRLALSGGESEAVARWSVTRRRLSPGLADLAPSRRRKRARGLRRDEILAAASLLRGADRRAATLLASSGDVPLPISGADLVRRGVPPGPAIGRALAATRAALEDGRIRSEDALAYALRRSRGRAR
jgi:tRNA nucleotidyltransferase (CCA-adding enzyme)